MYSLMGQNQRAFQIIQQGLTAWPQDLRLLSLGSRVAGHVGDATTQIKLLERAVAIDPADPVLANMLRQARETPISVPEPISD
jgi:hypothetical protein